ncbi:uncharacterized protein LOC134708501 [Mytilus trossulus]|uniref:uncharacterized protein LOC134708501 n=1 Tax=Mytilus trossulus TaxID=6551 RepID=UPI003007362D
MACFNGTDDSSAGFVIGAVFSLADDQEKIIPENDDANIQDKRSQTHDDDIYLQNFLSSSPIPVKKCSVRVKNFIEKDIRNTLTEACNNAIVKQEPAVENEQQSTNTEENITNRANQVDRRPSRKRKPNSLMSSDFLFKATEIREFQKSISRRTIKQDAVTCQIDHDLVMSVAEKCIPEVVEKSGTEDIKMVSILPPTLKVNINDTSVLVDWKAKISHTVSESEVKKRSRPQTARTKKKLRTQEQIDLENSKKNRKSKPRPKSKKKTTVADPSPPHLEPYGGQLLHIHSSKYMSSPSSPDGLPPQLKPYEIASSESRTSIHKTSDGKSNLKKPPKLDQIIRNEQSSREHSPLADNRVPCSLTGRMRKPNQQFEKDFLTGTIKYKKEDPHKQISNNKDSDNSTSQNKLEEHNSTIDHDSNKVHVTMLPNNKHSTVSSDTMSYIIQTANQFADKHTEKTQVIKSKAISSSGTGLQIPKTTQQKTSTNTKLTSAIGELAKMENTKKFFQLIVGDKVVLIPTNGESVVPKAFVMDIAATRPGSSIALNKQTVSASNTPKTFMMNIAGTKQENTISQPRSIQSSSSVLIASAQGQNVQTQPIVNKVLIQKQSTNQIVQNTSVSSPQNMQGSQRMPLLANVLESATRPTILPNPILRPVTTPLLSNIPITVGPSGQTILYPFGRSTAPNIGQPFPTFIITNTSQATNGQPPVVTSVLKDVRSSISTSPGITIKTEPASTVSNPARPAIKNEPNNIKDYEKAASSFKGVPDDGSETESDDETQSAQSERQSTKTKVLVPEVGVHVPASESETSERIRKLKEKLREQRVQVENMRKNMPTRSEINDHNS